MVKRRTAQHGGALVLAAEDGRALRAQQKREATELVAHIRRNMQFITDAFFEVGVALTTFANNHLYVALGYTSFAEALDGLHLMSQSQANKLIAVAELVPREAAVQLGPEKSYQLTRYVQVAPEQTSVQQVLDAGHVNGKPLAQVSVRELRDTTRQLTDHAASKGKPAGDGKARHAQAQLRKRGWDGVQVTPVSKGTRVRLELEMDVLERVLRK